jgi:hypothetical protein
MFSVCVVTQITYRKHETPTKQMVVTQITYRKHETPTKQM